VTPRLVALAALAVAGTLLGCAAKKPVARVDGPGYTTTGSVAHGTFVKRSEARLEPDAPIVALDFVGETLLAKTDRNAVYALSGSLDLRYRKQVADAGLEVRKPILFGGQTLFATPSELRFFDNSGAVAKTVRMPNPITSDLSLDPRNLLLVGTAAPTGGRVTVVDPQQPNKPIKEETLLGTIRAAPAGFQGIVYAATNDGRVFAIGQDRRGSWPLPGSAFQTQRAVTADLVVDDYALYVASTDTKLYALDRTSGHIKWRYMGEAALTTSPFVTADRVYQVVGGAGLVALAKQLPEDQDRPYREPVWTAEGVTRVLGADAKYVYVVRGKGTVAALDVATGEQVFDVKGDFSLYAIGPDKTIYAADRAGRVQSFSRGPYTGEDAGVAAAR
jgi:hypothetical protein